MGQTIVTHSYSGQFVVKEAREEHRWARSPHVSEVPIAATHGFLVTPLLRPPPDDPLACTLAAQTVVVSAERLKELVLRDLGLKDAWRGQIEIVLDSSLPTNSESLTLLHGRRGWDYQLLLPKTIHPDDLVLALAQTMLVEIANRNAGDHIAEIPYWVTAGMTAHIEAFNPPTFILKLDSQSAGFFDMKIAGLEAIRAGLRDAAPLTFQQMSWPESVDATGANKAALSQLRPASFSKPARFSGWPGLHAAVFG